MEEQTTILIVDDESIGREALEGVLFSQGYNLIFAENGEMAYRKALEFMPDLILLDVMMPNMNGYDVCRRMRSDPLLAEVPILIVTALDDRNSRLKGIEAGADDFISKPFDRIELRARVRTITRLNRYRRSLMERARFIWVVEQAREGYLILTAGGQIKFANPAARALLELPAEGSLTVNFIEAAQKSFHCEPEANWNAWQTDAEIRAPLYLIRPEAGLTKPAWFQVELLQLPIGEVESSILVRLTEISQSLTFLQEIGAFHSLISHKLRTPIASILMVAELLKKEVQNGVVDNLLDLTDTMISGTRRLEGEIQDIFLYLNSLQISKTGKAVSLAELIKLARQTGEEFGTGSFVIDCDRSMAPSQILNLSHHSLEIILHEIMENARKFHPGLAPNIAVQITPAVPGAVRLTIQDDGLHLAPDQLTRVWQPYYQAEKEFTGEVEGMGLGLSTVAMLVWGAGGKCRLYNRENGPGVTVELILPLRDELPAGK